MAGRVPGWRTGRTFSASLNRSYQFPAPSFQIFRKKLTGLLGSSWELEAGSWNMANMPWLEAGSWKLEAGSRSAARESSPQTFHRAVFLVKHRGSDNECYV